MIWKPEVGLGDLLNLVALLGAAIGLLLTYRQLKHSAATARAEFVKSLVSEFYGTRQIYEAFYQIDCGTLAVEKITDWKEEDLDSYKELEMGLDHLLSYLDLVARLVQGGTIKDQDARALEYEFVICFTSPAVQRYLEYLDKLYIKKRASVTPHPYFRQFASALVNK